MSEATAGEFYESLRQAKNYANDAEMVADTMLERSQEQQQSIGMFISSLASKRSSEQFTSDIETFVTNLQEELKKFRKGVEEIKDSLKNILQDDDEE